MSYAAEVQGDLPERYFREFSQTEQMQHHDALESLGASGDADIQIEPLDGSPGGDAAPDPAGPAGEMAVRITLIAFDVPNLFAVVTGTLAVMGCEITSGSSCTARPQSTGGFLPLQDQKRRIIDVFTGILDPQLDFEVWRVRLVNRVREIMQRLGSGSEQQVREVNRELLQSVAEVLAQRREGRRAALPPVTAEVEASDIGTRISITSEDSPFFLYSAANALSLHGVSIEGVEIRTVAGRVQDVFELVDAFGRSLDDKDTIEHLRFSLVFTKQFTYHLAAAPDPFSAIQRFEELMQRLMGMAGDADIREALTDPSLQEELARLLGASDFLWEDFIRQQHEQILPMLSSESRGRILSMDEARVGFALDDEVDEAVGTEEKIRVLNEFKDREIFRIDVDHILHPDLDFFFLSKRLVRLAEEVVRAALEIAYAEFVATYGTPRTAGGMAVPYAVFGLGKLGGEALGYASDLEVLCMYADSGRTDGENAVSNRMFFEKMFTFALRAIRARKEGIFRVDPRLRPHGEDGPLACTLDSFLSYYQRGGAAHSYERLALIRLRRVAGDAELGAQVERLRDELVYQSDSIDLQEIRELRARQLVHKSEKQRYNAKFSPGALVDLEYNVQIMQVEHGGSNPRLRTPRLHEALNGLRRAGALGRDEAQQLIDAYRFFRHLINGLRMLRGNALDLFLPQKGSMEFAHLARRMGYRHSGASAAEQLYMDFQQCTAEVRSIVERHLGRGAIPGDFLGNILDLVLRTDVRDAEAADFFAGRGFREPQRTWLHIRSLDTADPGGFRRVIVLAFDILTAQPDPDLALLHWTQLVEGLDAGRHYKALSQQPKRMEILFGLFGVSRFLSDILIQHPEFFDWVTEPSTVARVRSLQELHRDVQRDMQQREQNGRSRRDVLRLFRKREMVRIGTRDLQIAVPLKHTLSEISNLAQAVVSSALDSVCQERHEEMQTAGADPGRLCVLAFGKFGGEELNYSSDIDLVAIYRQADTQRSQQEERIYAEIIREVTADLSEYTAEGYAYRVDMRLRPYGSSGELVWSLPRILQYYRTDASLWEYQAAIKLRPVAGNPEVGQEFLAEIRRLLPDLAGDARIVENIRTLRAEAVQQYRSKQLRLQPSGTFPGGTAADPVEDAYVRLPSADIKNGVGGIRDIEFLVQGLQLIHCGRAPEILTGNTLSGLRFLARAEVLPHEDAALLAEHYLYLRRLEHLLQIFEDRQVHALPRDERALTRLARKHIGPQATAVDLLRDSGTRMADVRRLYDRYLQ